jgi:hypothetical protein
VLGVLTDIVVATRGAIAEGVAVDPRGEAFAIEFQAIGTLAVALLHLFDLISQSTDRMRGQRDKRGAVHVPLSP